MRNLSFVLSVSATVIWISWKTSVSCIPVKSRHIWKWGPSGVSSCVITKTLSLSLSPGHCRRLFSSHVNISFPFIGGKGSKQLLNIFPGPLTYQTVMHFYQSSAHREQSEHSWAWRFQDLTLMPWWCTTSLNWNYFYLGYFFKLNIQS